MRQQRGSLLIELGIVVVLLIMLASWALPELSRSMTERKMETAEQTVRQTIQRARLMARNRNTWVELKISQDQLILTAKNNNTLQETILLPKDIVFSTELSLRYTPNGVLQRDEQNPQAVHQVQIHANNNLAENINITIDPMGWASL